MPAQPAPTTRRNSAESPSSTELEPQTLSLDVVFDVLSNERRRRTIRYLLAEPGTITLGDLAEHIASLENGKPEEALTSTERKRVYICLYQSHLPKLDDADIVDFDGDRKTIETGDAVDQVTRFLPEEEDAEAAAGGWTTAFTRVTAVVGGWLGATGTR